MSFAVLVALAVQCGVAFATGRRLRRAWCRAAAWPLEAGRESGPVARRLLDGLGARVVVAGASPGGYRQSDRTLLLAPEVIAAPSLAALAVVVHEAGHADQHRAAPLLLALNRTVRRLVPLVFLVALGLGAVALTLGSARALLVGQATAEVALLLAVVASLLEHDASARGARRLAAVMPLGPPEDAALRSMLAAAAWSYLALPFVGLPPLAVRRCARPSGAR